jgi:hypothetical protein
MDTPADPTRNWSPNITGDSIVHRNGYEIELARFRTADDLDFWVEHMSGKGWVSDQDLASLMNEFHVHAQEIYGARAMLAAEKIR